MSTIQNFSESFDSNNDKNKLNLDYYPNVSDLTMEQQFKISQMSSAAKNMNKEQIYCLFMDLLALNERTINTYKMMFKG